MGKMMRSYSIFVLFLLISISAFAGWGNGKIPPGQAKKNNDKTNEQVNESNGNDAWIEKVELLERNQVKISLITRTQKYINNLTIEETNGYKVITLYKREDITNGSKKNIYRWSINYGIKPEDRAAISFEIRKNHYHPVDGTNSIGGKEISYDISDLIPPKEEEIEIDIKTYEEVKQPNKPEIRKGKYVFTKGGKVSNISNPAVYVIIPISEEIEKLRIEKLRNGRFKNKDKNKNKAIISIVSSDDKNKVVKVEFDFKEGKNTVKVTPIKENNIKGEPKILKFIVDTKIKNSYLEKEDIISELDMKDGKPVIKIKLSKFEELSGINKYSYTLSNGFQREEEDVSVAGGKYLTPTPEEDLVDIEIPLEDFSEGSRLSLSFEVYDRVGNKKTYEKTYFIPKQADKIIAKISGDIKQRNSKIKIVTEGSKDEFGIGSSVDGSSEWSSED